MTFSEIILVGNLGRDPEMRYTDGGTAICDFSLAVNRVRRVNNELVSDTTWFKVTLWGKEAENAGNLLHKGRQVLVVGDRIEANAYMANDGTPRASLQVTARSFRLVGSRADNEGGGQARSSGSSGGGQKSGGQYQASQYDESEYYDDAPENADDIPF